MLDVIASLEHLVEVNFSGAVTAILSDSYLLNGCLSGEIFADKQKRFGNGKRIMTSPLNFAFEVTGYQFALTQSGNLYLIASWRQFDDAWAHLNFNGDGLHATDFLFRTDPERPIDFDNETDAVAAPETDLIKFEIPNRRSRRSIVAEAEPSTSDLITADERNSEIFQLALKNLDKSQLHAAFDSAQSRFVTDEKREVMIEYTKREPDAFLLPMIALGYVPRWQAVLVLDGQFNVSRKASGYLADELVAKLPMPILPEHLRDRRFQADLGL